MTPCITGLAGFLRKYVPRKEKGDFEQTEVRRFGFSFIGLEGQGRDLEFFL